MHFVIFMCDVASDPGLPASVSQCTWVTDVGHHIWLAFIMYKFIYLAFFCFSEDTWMVPTHVTFIQGWMFDFQFNYHIMLVFAFMDCSNDKYKGKNLFLLMTVTGI